MGKYLCAVNGKISLCFTLRDCITFWWCYDKKNNMNNISSLQCVCKAVGSSQEEPASKPGRGQSLGFLILPKNLFYINGTHWNFWHCNTRIESFDYNWYKNMKKQWLLRNSIRNINNTKIKRYMSTFDIYNYTF